MKKLINRPEDAVKDELAGVAAAHADRLRVYTEPDYIVRLEAPIRGKVAIVSGGGSGHEPLHGGFVGRGMLDAACPGAVFTSPTPDQVLAATKAVDGGAGVLHIVKNYTGDVMNFEMAADLARDEGIAVESVVIADDVAVQDSLYTAGRRGVGTTVLAEKICGAAAELRRPLADVAELCRRVNDNGAQHGHGPHLVHRADGRQAHARAGSRRDRGRRRHPRRARSRAPPGGLGARRRGDAGDGHPRRSALRPRRPRAGLRQRPGRHPAHGALRSLSTSSTGCSRAAASPSPAT